MKHFCKNPKAGTKETCSTQGFVTGSNHPTLSSDLFERPGSSILSSEMSHDLQELQFRKLLIDLNEQGKNKCSSNMALASLLQRESWEQRRN